MNREYTYFQTLQNMPEGMSVYAIQSVNRDDVLAPPDEDSISGFGPLGRINILVGATNAGKSRFLRMLAQSRRFVLQSEKTNASIADLKICPWLLSKTDGEIRFQITNNSGHSAEGPHAFHGLPPWARTALEGLRSGINEVQTFDSTFFSESKYIFESVIDNYYTTPNKPMNMSTQDMKLRMFLWAGNLLRGEELVQEDERKNKPSGSLAISKRELHGIRLNFDSISPLFREHYIRLWEALTHILTTNEFSEVVPTERIYTHPAFRCFFKGTRWQAFHIRRF